MPRIDDHHSAAMHVHAIATVSVLLLNFCLFFGKQLPSCRISDVNLRLKSHAWQESAA